MEGAKVGVGGWTQRRVGRPAGSEAVLTPEKPVHWVFEGPVRVLGSACWIVLPSASPRASGT